MEKYQSKIQPEYSVQYYSKKLHGSGSGYYLCETKTGKGYSPIELNERGATDETIEELKYKGHMEAFGEPYHYTFSNLVGGGKNEKFG